MHRLLPVHNKASSRLPGTPLSELWPELSPDQRNTVKARLCDLLVRMRAPRFDYYGRPMGRPYVLASEFGSEAHAYCASRTEWDDSRIRALHASSDPGQDPDRVRALERTQRETGGVDGWDRPVLTHGDLSDRNVLVDPNTLEVTGVVDWEMANAMPAYFEYVAARLSGGHLPEWRRELLDVLREVLCRECGVQHGGESSGEGRAREGVEADGGGKEGYKRALAAWDAVVDVERIAQGYSDDCAWTFEL